MIKNFIKSFALVATLTSTLYSQTESPKNIAGVYPSLTMYNNEGECGPGAVVPWGDNLWIITYSPHYPMGSTSKLYQITPELTQIIRPESVGGTPANRMIHKESQQLNIGPYFIKKDASVRTISPKQMPGRHTGTARHLTDPENKVYIATMEEGLYSVDVNTLEVEEHIKDGNKQKAIGKGIHSKLPGYHGKGLYSGQGMLIYSNNGEKTGLARKRPDIPSGALASWQGKGDWKLIRRNQFTEVTGPGGIYGNQNTDDQIWAMGWDYRSLILMLLQDKQWHAYRLPKGSHSYDGAHGWNTEWPRIRDIEEKDLLATMHGTFWKFPKDFSLENSAGIVPRSNYLKVIGDFSIWKDKLVLGCDDSAQKEFLNHRPFKSTKGAPAQSNSNLWFIDPAQLDQMGPVIGRGSVWLRDDVKANQTSDPYLFSGYDYRNMVITHNSKKAVEFTIEVDVKGNNQWTKLEQFSVEKSLIHQFPSTQKAAWIRLKTNSDAKAVSVHFHYSNKDLRSTQNDALFTPIAKLGETAKTKGLIRSNRKVLSLQNDSGSFAVNTELEMIKTPDNSAFFKGAEQVQNIIQVDEASAIINEDGKRYRLPKNDAYKNIDGRICREVATERDLFNFHGTFYELPARNAQGFAKIRPIATHNLAIDDYASHFGLIFITGLNSETNERTIQNKDGNAAVWAGVIDDLWKLGKPRGLGGPWKNTSVKAGVASDPYLMTGYDKKSLELTSDKDAKITLEVDIDGTGLWVKYKSFELVAGKTLNHTFPEGFSAYWVRAISSSNTKATALFTYE
ncbi:hypothetical protein PQO03_14095 [Lentisphaera profundi]|uniref:Uncharacterized protein n=1 Tax=Lentisphaera profundi TaxID=1658616 RepID=A0ABY7W1I3_9BACT|nr:hypothetical protein [Lentisphaera profundi]WDE98967.1 hypothetical protein PQO03_14095 [Lentisphaera profundi]